VDVGTSHVCSTNALGGSVKSRSNDAADGLSWALPGRRRGDEPLTSTAQKQAHSPPLLVVARQGQAEASRFVQKDTVAFMECLTGRRQVAAH
jgi:hypothetical protein